MQISFDLHSYNISEIEKALFKILNPQILSLHIIFLISGNK